MVVVLSALVPLSANVALAQEGDAAESEPGFFGRLFGFGQSDKAEDRADKEEREREARREREEEARERAREREEMDREHARERREMERESAERRREMEREHRDERGENIRENAADRGRKKGWVDGMPPGQAKNKGKSRQQRGREEQYEDRDYENRESETDNPQSDASGSTPTQPRSAEDVLRDRAKDEAVRASGVAEGSAEEELIRIGTDAVIDRAK